MTGSPRPLILAAGLFSSGSTWTFNALRAMLRRRLGAAAVVSLYADQVSDALFEASVATVVKTHAPSSGLIRLATLVDAPVSLTVRDPRDAVASLITRFQRPSGVAIAEVARSAEALVALAANVPHQIWRFESRFMNEPSTVRRLAQLAGLTLEGREDEAIHRALAPGSVRRFAGRLDQPNGRPADIFDPATHWHPNHVGDGRSGKFAEVLATCEAARVMFLCRAFTRRFGYDEPTRPVAPGLDLDFRFAAGAHEYLAEGFSEPETWGAWTSAPEARVHVPMTRPVARGRLSLGWRLSPAFFAQEDPASLQVLVNGLTVAELSDGAAEPFVRGLSVNLPPIDEDLDLTFRFGGLRPVHEFGFHGDSRAVGVGLTSLRVDV